MNSMRSSVPSTWAGYGTGSPALLSWLSAANSASAHWVAIIARPAAVRLAMALLSRDARTLRPSRYWLSRWNMRCSAFRYRLAASRHDRCVCGTAHQEHLRFLACLEDAEFGVDGRKLGDKPVGVGPRATVRRRRLVPGGPPVAFWQTVGGIGGILGRQPRAVPVAPDERQFVIVKAPLAAARIAMGRHSCAS